MADDVAPAFQLNSPEQVAFKLLELVSSVERTVDPNLKSDRKYLLDAYAECLHAVNGLRTPLSDAPTDRVRTRNWTSTIILIVVVGVFWWALGDRITVAVHNALLSGPPVTAPAAPPAPKQSP